MKKLTSKQQAFAQAVASGMTHADAYRAAYDASKMKAAAIQSKAYELMQDGEITARVTELRQPVIEKAQITLQSHLEDLLTLRDGAASRGLFGVAVTAEIARGKASGVRIERAEVAFKVKEIPAITKEMDAATAARIYLAVMQGDK